mmetsp:Transcript_49099/g.110464  ORF Transcript_49099/g.110464 Transcript_49099/m.110464 type:complete len:442 (-) Transcript_49099:83-1408(-)
MAAALRRPSAASILIALTAFWNAWPGTAILHRAVQDDTDMQVLPNAKCGVVMVAMGEVYSKIAMQVAMRTRMLKALPGWCPSDPGLTHIPVTLFSDMSVGLLRQQPARGVNLMVIRNYSDLPRSINSTGLMAPRLQEFNPVQVRPIPLTRLTALRRRIGDKDDLQRWYDYEEDEDEEASNIVPSSADTEDDGSEDVIDEAAQDEPAGTRAADLDARREVVSDLRVRPESDMQPWQGIKDSQIQEHLGSWKVRWYHVQSMLESPYEMTMYMDIDAYACSAEGVGRLLKQVADNNAAVGSPMLPEKLKCKSSQGNCTYPHPQMSLAEVKEWTAFTERNAGVLVIDMRKGRPILESFGATLQAAAGKITGDQWAFRAALFKHRNMRQVIFSNDDVCRYAPAGSCNDQNSRLGCAVHHTCKMQSLIRYGVVPANIRESMGINPSG